MERRIKGIAAVVLALIAWAFTVGCINAAVIEEEQQRTTTPAPLNAAPVVYVGDIGRYAEPDEEPVDVEEVEKLACAIYQEGGADYVCDECRYRIGDVILSRVESEDFPDTLEEVLTQRGQYGRFYWTGIVWPDRAERPEEAAAVARAYKTAYELIVGARHSDLHGQGYIWQAEFKQGTDIVNHCGIYFGR